LNLFLMIKSLWALTAADNLFRGQPPEFVHSIMAIPVQHCEAGVDAVGRSTSHSRRLPDHQGCPIGKVARQTLRGL
jgi:hypothetical protein